MNKKIAVGEKTGPLDDREKPQTINGINFVFPVPITWDGSYLGTIAEYEILDKIIFEGKELWKVDFIEDFVLVHSAINQLPCINDELLVLFGLNKLGTHSVKYKNRLYIISRMYKTDYILGDNYERVSEDIKLDVKKIITLKIKLGWSKFDEDNIILRFFPEYNRYCAIPIHENTVGNKAKIISQKLSNKWLGSIHVDDSIFRNLLLSDNTKSLITESFKLIGKIETCINRIEPELIYIINDIRKNIMLVC